MKPRRFDFTPERVYNLRDDEVLVFGSNIEGRHGSGLALYCKLKFGAKQGTGSGRTGQCYALPTKGYLLEVFPLSAIRSGIMDLIAHARKNVQTWFIVTKIGCGLAGYEVGEIAGLWKGLIPPPNMIIPVEFHRAIIGETPE